MAASAESVPARPQLSLCERRQRHVGDEPRNITSRPAGWTGTARRQLAGSAVSSVVTCQAICTAHQRQRQKEDEPRAGKRARERPQQRPRPRRTPPTQVIVPSPNLIAVDFKPSSEVVLPVLVGVDGVVADGPQHRARVEHDGGSASDPVTAPSRRARPI